MFGIPLTATALKASLWGNVALAGLLAATVGSWAWHAHHLGVKVTTATRAEGGAKALLDGCTSSNAGWEAEGLQARLELGQCQAQWREQDLTAKAAVAQAQAASRAAQAERDAFERRWQARSRSCGAALLDMQAACAAEIGDY
jgi:hypothetical protein